eukprot:jgi/Chlat1/581/Chrsp103S01143
MTCDVQGDGLETAARELNAVMQSVLSQAMEPTGEAPAAEVRPGMAASLDSARGQGGSQLPESSMSSSAMETESQECGTAQTFTPVVSAAVTDSDSQLVSATSVSGVLSSSPPAAATVFPTSIPVTGSPAGQAPLFAASVATVPPLVLSSSLATGQPMEIISSPSPQAITGAVPSAALFSGGMAVAGAQQLPATVPAVAIVGSQVLAGSATFNTADSTLQSAPPLGFIQAGMASSAAIAAASAIMAAAPAVSATTGNDALQEVLDNLRSRSEDTKVSVVEDPAGIERSPMLDSPSLSATAIDALLQDTRTVSSALDARIVRTNIIKRSQSDGAGIVRLAKRRATASGALQRLQSIGTTVTTGSSPDMAAVLEWEQSSPLETVKLRLATAGMPKPGGLTKAASMSNINGAGCHGVNGVNGHAVPKNGRLGTPPATNGKNDEIKGTSIVQGGHSHCISIQW